MQRLWACDGHSQCKWRAWTATVSYRGIRTATIGALKRGQDMKYSSAVQHSEGFAKDDCQVAAQCGKHALQLPGQSSVQTATEQKLKRYSRDSIYIFGLFAYILDRNIVLSAPINAQNMTKCCNEHNCYEFLLRSGTTPHLTSQHYERETFSVVGRAQTPFCSFWQHIFGNFETV